MCHVLIIEDEPIVAMVLQALLEDEGATSVDVADTEKGAVAAALAHRPDFITSDVRLLDGTGPGAVTQIHLALGDIPVVFITASPEECTPCDPPGRILPKPLNERAVVHAFHEMVVL